MHGEAADQEPVEPADGASEEDLRTTNLLSRARTGDKKALIELVQRDVAWLSAHVHHHLGSVRSIKETQDVVQDVMMKLLTSGPPLRAMTRPMLRAMLKTIVHNLLATQAGKGARLPALPGEETLLEVIQGRAWFGETPADLAAHREERDAFRLALLLQPGVDQDLLRARYVKGLPWKEVGAKFGLSADDARMRCSRAYARLRQTMVGVLAGKRGRAEAPAEDDDVVEPA